MSHTIEDLLLDAEIDAQDSKADWEEMLSEHAAEVLEGFTASRLKSFYIKNPGVAERALAARSKAKKLIADGHESAALVFAVTATELGYKVCVLRPIVSGLVHTEAMADLIMTLTTEHTGLDRFEELLTAIVEGFAGVDIKAYKRTGSKQLFWQEMNMVIKRRNAVVHRGEDATSTDAELSVNVAGTILDVLLPKVLAKLDLRLKSGRVVKA
jgi:hypothetical protein